MNQRRILLTLYVVFAAFGLSMAQESSVYIEVLGLQGDVQSMSVRLVDRTPGRSVAPSQLELSPFDAVTLRSDEATLEEGEFRLDFPFVEDKENTYFQIVGLDGEIIHQDACINNHFRFEGGQGYRMPIWNNPNGTIQTCGGDFYDEGGSAGNYANGLSLVTTFCPDNGSDCIEVSFSSFQLQSSNYDYLRIYDGPTVNATLINQYTGGVNPGTITATEGCLTFEFVSNGSQVYSGWEATVSCVTCAVPPTGINTDNGCPAINAGPDIAMPTCYTPCTPQDVTASFFDTGETTSYNLESIPYDPVYPYNLGTIFGTTGSHEQWSDVISLPFTFCFYGNTFDEVVVGSNGVLSFNSSYANGVCDGTINGPIPNASLPLNSIFGIFSDLEPTACGQPRYAILGEAPCRALIVSYDQVCFNFCNTVQNTSQIVLYETTNVIEIYIDLKPICTNQNIGKSIMGIQNEDGTQGLSSSSPNRNGVSLWFASQEAWRFTPNGTSIVTINWYDQSNGYLGSGATIGLCAEDLTQTFVAEAEYTGCEGNTVTVSDDVIIACAQVLLPVEWASFDAKVTELEHVKCDWVTASEINNSYFTVERSADKEHWDEIGVVQASGISYGEQDYTFTDTQPLGGTSYYRIRQNDINGDFTHSPIRAVSLQSDVLSVYPNPSEGVYRVIGLTGQRVRVYDYTGRQVEFQIQGNELTLSDPKPGYYILETSSGSEGQQQIRLIVK